MSRSPFLKTSTPPFTNLGPGIVGQIPMVHVLTHLLIPIPMVVGLDSFDPHHLHSDKSSYSESNMPRGRKRCNKSTRGDTRCTRHPIYTAQAKQVSQFSSVNTVASGMGCTGEPCTASEAGFSSPYMLCKLLINLRCM